MIVEHKDKPLRSCSKDLKDQSGEHADSEANGISDDTDIATRPHIELLALALRVHQLTLDALTQLLGIRNFHSLNCGKVLCLTALKVQLGNNLVQRVTQL